MELSISRGSVLAVFLQFNHWPALHGVFFPSLIPVPTLLFPSPGTQGPVLRSSGSGAQHQVSSCFYPVDLAWQVGIHVGEQRVLVGKVQEREIATGTFGLAGG